MVFGFGSSNSSASSSSVTTLPDGAPPAPTREERRKCWTARDSYFGCLDKNNIVIAGEESKNPDRSDIKGGGPICKVERESYSQDCAKAWVDYFNKRRILDARQRMSLQVAADQGVKVPEYKR